MIWGNGIDLFYEQLAQIRQLVTHDKKPIVRSVGRNVRRSATVPPFNIVLVDYPIRR